MLLIKPGWLPASVGVTMATGSVTVFVIAVLRGDVTPYVPYISEAGAKSPQNGIFSICLFFSAILSLLTMYARYSVVQILNDDLFKEVTIFNGISLVFGMLSTLGLIIVASYPVTVDETAHNLGAYTLFLMGVIYFCLQTRITFKMCPLFNGSLICWIRMVLTMVSITAVAIVVIYDPIAKKIWTTSWPAHSKIYRHPGDAGFEEFLIASIAEWTLAVTFVLFFYTFVREFNKICIHLNAVPLVGHFDDDVTDKCFASDEEKQPILVP